MIDWSVLWRRHPIDRAQPAAQLAPLYTLPAETEEERAAFQVRLSWFAWMMFGQSVAFDSLSAVSAIARGGSPGVVVSRPELAANILLLSLALICRYARLSARALAILDPFVLFCVTAPTILFGIAGSADSYAELITSVATMPLCVVRAALIPSTPRRTLVITAVAALPGLAVAWMTPLDDVAVAAREFVRLERLMNTALWWAIQVAVATLTTKIIYGLQQRVREAERFGQYLLEQKIGEGGMGVVYRASHALLRRPTAVKLLRTDQVSEQAMELFAREVRLTARLAHANIVTIYDYGRTRDGTFYYAMELLDGIDLQELVRRDGPLPAARVRHLLIQMAEALAEAHAIGLIHRDVKPANIMLCPPSTRHELAKLLDFGLVHHIAELERGTPLQDSGRGTPSDDLDPARTATGARFLFGTPLYMSPEAISRPDTIGPRSDLYALGAVGYFLLAGAPVFDALTLGDLCDQQLHAEPIAPSVRLGAAVPEGLERAVLHLLEKDPERRTSSAMAFAQELSALIDAVPWTADDARNWWAKHGQRRVYAEGSSFVPGDPPRRSAALSLKLDIRLR